MQHILFHLAFLLLLKGAFAQNPNPATLRGSNGIHRSAWDVLHYDLTIEPDLEYRTIAGKNTITFLNKGTQRMQIDLQKPMQLDSAILQGRQLSFNREGNVFWVDLFADTTNVSFASDTLQIDLYFKGRPGISRNPPWDGGWVWHKDAMNRPWVTVACQGLGASAWFPCKDYQGDEPDLGCILRIITPDTLDGIGNGRLIQRQRIAENKMMHVWQTLSPINAYNIIPTIGKFKHLTDTFPGEKGKLSLDYWVLDYNANKAPESLSDVPRTLRAMEHWFGPFPFYEDGFKLVESPHLGMEHQSNIAYGNNFKKGYKGSDLSKTGYGLLWDFVIVHETGHEWFGNSITTEDIADMWVHEGFTHYSEALFTEYHFGKEAGKAYAEGTRINIRNDRPVTGRYGINEEGSSDMYFKGAAAIHMLRYWMNDDEKFRQMLRSMNEKYYHSIVTAKEIIQFISTFSGLSTEAFFEQYLTTTLVPRLEWKIKKNELHYKWENVVDGFNMPITVTDKRRENRIRIYPEKGKWNKVKWTGKTLKADSEWYIKQKP